MTGGLHAAAAFTPQGELVALREDIGRHNAVDKVVGEVVLAGDNVRDRGILVSGRLSLEMVYKGARAGASLICSVSAPTSMAVELAESVGCTLVGFLRGRGFNIYTHPDRLTGPSPRD